ncbi:MAG: sugar-binding domain-containing protein [Opitutaceae bacterium]|nr:sugar-binding domain-containing protein [Opitutaceae bacterium]
MPAKAAYPDDILRMAATLYYVDGLGQTEVAKLVRVSQTKISRLLAAALERGIVRINVEEYHARHDKLEHQLCSRFGLRSAAVIKTARNAGAEAARQTVGHFGAPFVASVFPKSGVVAVGGGRSVAEVVQRFRRGESRRLTVVQAMGSIDSNLSHVDALELGRAMVKLWGGEFLTLSTPAFVSDKKTRDFFLASQQIKFVWQRLRQADAAIVGVGPLDLSVYLERGVLGAADVAHLRGCGAVGEICGRFFDAKGRECASRWRDRVISIELELLKKIPQVIGVAAGPERAPALAGALRGGLLKSLLIDEALAQALLA